MRRSIRVSRGVWIALALIAIPLIAYGLPTFFLVLANLGGLWLLLTVAVGPAVIIGRYYKSWGRGFAVASLTGVAWIVSLVVWIFLARSGVAISHGEGSGLLEIFLAMVVGSILGVTSSLLLFSWADESPTGPELPSHIAEHDAAIIATRRQANGKRDPFDYTFYTFAELRDAQEHLDAEAYPDRAEILRDEIARRRDSRSK